MSVIIGADIVPVECNSELFVESRLEELVGADLVRLLNGANYRIFNLETPLTVNSDKLKKYGPHLIAHVDTVKGIKALGVDLLTLANNHIMDQNIQGLDSTILTLEKAEIAHVGAGKDIYEAQKAFFFQADNKQYGVYACAEHEFSIATEGRPGANPFEPMESLDHIVQVKSQCDYVIVLYHGGKEHYRYPSPNLQKKCRKMIEKGADLVVCQHSHCIGCKEEYLNGTIIYGQGNFLFNKKDNEFWNTSLLIKLHNNGTIEYIPVKRYGSGIRIAIGNEANEIITAFEKRSSDIRKTGFVERHYRQYAKEMLPGYILYFTGIQKNLAYRIINKLSRQRLRRHIENSVRSKRGLGMINYIECEAHRELLLKGLEFHDDEKSEYV